jgi:hypothetical protein
MKYIANPVEVDAFVIKHVELWRYETEGVSAHPGAVFTLTLDNHQMVVADSGMTSRMVPKVGDYWVVQSDGYVYLNPKDVFERKYHAA